MTYGSEKWGVKKTQEDRLNVVEMKILRWVSGHNLKNRVENRAIQEGMKVMKVGRFKKRGSGCTCIYSGEMKVKLQGKRWRWKWKGGEDREDHGEYGWTT